MTAVTGDSKFATAQWIVSPAISDGATHTTITAAVAAASSGDTIFIKPGTYTEDFTLGAGINLAAYDCDSLTPNVTIAGKITCSATGTMSISGIQLETNADFALEVSGANDTNVFVKNCFFNCTDNTGISLSSSGDSLLTIENCRGDITNTGIALFEKSDAELLIDYCQFKNSGGSTTASTNSGGQYTSKYTTYRNPFACSSNGNFSFAYCQFPLLTIGGVCITSAGTAISTISRCDLSTNTVACVTVGSGTTVFILDTTMNTNHTDVVDGAGTVNYCNVLNRNTGLPVITTTTQAGRYTELGKYHANTQPAFNAFQGTGDVDVTGDGTVYTLGDTDVGTTLTERFDQDSNFTPGASGGAFFTAPVTGRYQFNFFVLLTDLNTSHTYTLQLNTSNENYTYGNFPAGNTSTNWPLTMCVITDMDASDTAVFNVLASASTKVVNVFGSATTPRTVVSGFLVC